MSGSDYMVDKMEKDRDGACYVSTAVGFLMLLLAIAIAVGVGLIVHFAGGSREVVCTCPAPIVSESGQQTPPPPTMDPMYVKNECKRLALEGDSEICSACMDDTAQTTQIPLTHTATTQTTVITTTPKPPVLDVRLPMALYPVNFDVAIRPNMYEGDPDDFTFDGYVRIQLRCDTPANNVTLHMYDLKINNNTLEFGAEAETASAPSIVRWDYDEDRQFMVIHLDGMLDKGGLYYVKMNYTGPLTNDLAGLYLSSYERDNQTIYMATTQFEPTDARKAFPCFGEPAIKSNFSIALIRKSHMKSLSNMPIARSEDRGDNWIADIFETSPKMPVYLIALIVCDYEYRMKLTQNNVPYRAWSRPAFINQTTFALDVGVGILNYFENYFGIAYPLPKQDMIAVPDFVAGAMENWGLIVYVEDAMLFQPGVSTEANREYVSTVITHELAHQWFGNLVSPSWWDDLWLNEGFATFERFMGQDYYFPEWKMWDDFALTIQDVFNFDGLVSSHPVYVPVRRPEEIYEIFDSISYKKGAAIIRMMQIFLGKETFRMGLSNYLKSKAYGSAFHDDLWQAMTDRAAEDGKTINVKEIMDTWTLQMNYPVVMVTRVGNTRIRVSQQRYLIDPDAVDPGKYTSNFGYKWEIPFMFTSSREKNFNKTDADISWIQKNDTALEIDSPSIVPDPSVNNSWILGNPMQYGYYRVNYDTQNWQALINQLKTDHTAIHPVNRAQIINDAWNLAKAGMLSQDIAFQTVEYLDKEMHYIPWRAAAKELKYVKAMLSKTGLFGGFEAFMRSKTEAVLNTLSMNNTGATHHESYLRSTVAELACTYGVQSCIDESLGLYRQWMTNKAVNPIHPDLKPTVYCSAIRHGGAKEWDFAFDQYKTSTVVAEQTMLLVAMGCSREPWVISRYLTRAISQFRQRDALKVIIYVSENPIGHCIAWDYFRNKWDLIFSEFASAFFAFVELIGKLTSPFNTDFDLEQLEHFMETHPDQGTGARAFQQAVEKTQSNIKWMENTQQTIQTWLTNQGFYTE